MSVEPKTRVKGDYCGAKNVLIFCKLIHIFSGDEEPGGKKIATIGKESQK